MMPAIHKRVTAEISKPASERALFCTSEGRLSICCTHCISAEQSRFINP
jgi:hypothetical protein